ncbi:MAG: RNA polymerase sigma factor [Verrucomicrobiales bacterium]|jgi:RNA polymerase sigma-70 factor (ECF subfamily)|nr:RNA polymerase sigma factor [Verrucomicrobiales bacterium]
MNQTEELANESRLVGAAISGDADAFADLFNRYYAMIHAFAYRLTLSAHDADDIAQETFVSAARAIGGFRREASFKNWLYQIAANRQRDLFRQRQRRRDFNLPLTAGIEETHVAGGDGDIADFSPLHAALAALPDDWRHALVLAYYENRNHAEATQILGCAEATVSWRIFRAKRQLKQRLHHAAKRHE